MKDRSDYIVDDDSDEENDCEQSDLVNIMLNLAYVKKEVAQAFSFTPGYSQKLGNEIIKAKALNDSNVDFKSYKSKTDWNNEDRNWTSKKWKTVCVTLLFYIKIKYLKNVA